jgi:hypothetical protein
MTTILPVFTKCDTIEGLEESLGALLYDDHSLKITL